MGIRRTFGSTLIAATVAVSAASVGAAVGLASPAGALSTAPAYAGDFPDPTVITVGSGTTATYAAYATGAHGLNLQVMTSPDLVNWSTPVDPLPNLPGWATAGNTWAPGVIKVGTKFLMYYTVRSTALGMQCISVATSATPVGPFSDTSSGPLICQTSHGGSIDPSPMAVGSSLYLSWKSDDNALNLPTTYLWSQQLSASGLGLVGKVVRIMSGPTQTWQDPLIEGPNMVALPTGGFGLFYGAGWWESSGAAIGYATCPTPLSACTNTSTSQAWLGTSGAIVGPAGPSVFLDGNGVSRLAFHAWTGGTGPSYGQGGVRSLWINRIDLTKSPPALP